MRNQLVLVAYGSKRGGTAEIAQWVGDTLRASGLRVEVRPAAEVRKVDAYDVVIVGGALYAGRWHKDARRFVRRHAGALRARRVWLFASGPLDRSAEQDGRTPVPAALVRAAGTVGARGHIVFGGRLSPDAKGFPAAAMAKKVAGDYRNEARVRTWAAGLMAGMAEPAPHRPAEPESVGP
ncbi:flavodoxin domain-containing protein [Actinomadura scrupuli]|uniref:flavodoxin domain-containing protein n=1 Tax=Actinomadura scrupuli TaxID=559629 RepID=UPI003D98CADA